MTIFYVTTQVISGIGIIGIGLIIALHYFKQIKIQKSALASQNDLKNKEIPTKEELLKLLLFVLISRLVVYLVGYYFKSVNDNQWLSLFDSWQDIWIRWDSQHYLEIARNWYSTAGVERFNLVFYPLYPISLQVFSVVFKDYILSGVIASYIFTSIGCIYLYLYVKRQFDKDIALYSVALLLLNPYSFFTGIIYSESLFFLLTVMFFYYLREKDWVIAGLLAFFAGLTRNFGLLLMAPFVMEALKDCMIYGLGKLNKKMIGLFLCPSGFFVYLLMNQLITGSYTTFLTLQSENWHNQMNWIWKNVAQIGTNMFHYGPDMSLLIFIPQFIYFFMTLLILIWMLRDKKLPLSLIGYTYLYLLLTYLPSWLLSAGRYLSILFPIYIFISYKLKNTNSRLIVVLTSTALLILNVILFVSGRNIF